jgi:hypothetical protein
MVSCAWSRFGAKSGAALHRLSHRAFVGRSEIDSIRALPVLQSVLEPNAWSRLDKSALADRDTSTEML